MSFEHRLLFYFMWLGYKDKTELAGLLSFVEGFGVRILDLHTSGHSDSCAFDDLIQYTKPKVILPVKIENPEWFERYNDCSIIYDDSYQLDT